MNAEHERAKSKAKKQAKAEASKADVPKTAGDMSVIGTSKDGKRIYSWGDAGKGRVEVVVTPRKGRESVDPQASTAKQCMARETGQCAR